MGEHLQHSKHSDRQMLSDLKPGNYFATLRTQCRLRQPIDSRGPTIEQPSDDWLRFNRSTSIDIKLIGMNRSKQFTLNQTDESLLMGAPGYLDFTGSVIRYILNDREEKMELDKVLDSRDPRLPRNNTYLGYSMTTGFFDGNREYIVMGAPRFNRFYGKVGQHFRSAFGMCLI